MILERSHRRNRILNTVCVALAWAVPCSVHAAQAIAVPAPLPVEESGTAVLSAPAPHRLFLFDPYGSEGTVVIDGDDPSLKTLGIVPGARNASASMTLDGAKFLVSETYWTHGNRGERQDLLTVYDGRTLLLDKEIPLPGRLLVVPKAQQSVFSANGKRAFVYDMMPSSAIHIVDLEADKVVDSVDVPGCALAFPYGDNGVATICGDGTIGTIVLPSVGKAKAVFTTPFFDADKDPVFENSLVDRTTGEGWMLTFTGKIYPVSLGATAVVGKPWTISEAASMPPAGTGVQELAWRPGGMQLMAVHRSSKRLFVIMHSGNYWTHKEEGTEVWVLDAPTHKLVRRIRLASSAMSIAVTQDDKPLLFASGRSGALTVYDALTGEKLRERKGGGIIGMVTGW